MYNLFFEKVRRRSAVKSDEIKKSGVNKMNSKIPNVNDYLNLSGVSEIERMIKSNMLDVARPKAMDFLNESVISKSAREMQKMIGMPKDDYDLSAIAKMSSIYDMSANSIQKAASEHLQEMLKPQNLTGMSKQMEMDSRMSSMQKMLEPFGMQDILNSKSIASEIAEMQQTMGLKNEKFGLDSIKKSVLKTLDANKSSYLDSVRLAQEALNKNDLFHSQAIRTMREISELSSFKALSSLNNLPFEHLAKNFVFDERLLTTFDAGYLLGADLFEIDAEIAEEIADATDFNLLSDSAKQKLVYFYHNWLLPALISYTVAVATGSNPDVVENLSKLFAPHEQVKFIDTPFENNAPDHEFNVEDSETLAFSNHSANLVDEWTNEEEDRIWT